MSSALPIRRVVLYKHGVAYFERKGEVEGDQALHLDFKSRDMNDVLKSMTVLDLSGGSISAVSYDSTKPLEKLLEEATIRIPEDGSLMALLGQIKGARVRVKVGSELVEGALVGLDRLQIGSGEAVIERPFLTLFLSGTARTFDLTEIRELAFLDEPVRKDLEFYLATVLSSYKKDTRRVAVLTAGKGKRELFVSYVLEAPVWKTSYRILLDEKEPPLLQGWAVVDNTGDEDWVGVNLSLVSGLPVSFVHDLYSPRYQKRPIVAVQTEAAAAPIVPEEAYEGAAADEMMEEAEAAPVMAKAMRRAGGAPPMAAAAPAPRPMRELMERSNEVRTIVQETGDLFEYRVAQPVTVHRNQSALVPIVHRTFEGRRVLLYDERARVKNPMACIEFKNTTQLTLEGGPVTVFDGETYVGEAMLATLKPDDRRLVPYAVELGCTVAREQDSADGPVFRARVARGLLVTEYFQLRHSKYLIKNKSKRAQVLFIEHPRTGWELFKTADPAETTESSWRFKVELAPGASAELKIAERSPTSRQYRFESAGKDEIRFFLDSKFIDKRIYQALEEVLDLREKLNRANDTERRLIQAKNNIHKDQERLRANLQALKSGQEQRELGDRLVGKLKSQEDELERIDAALAKLVPERDQLAADIQARLQKLSFESELGEG